MTSKPEASTLYRAGAMIDQGANESAIRRATGLDRQLIRHMVDSSGPSSAQPNRPTGREMAVLLYIGDYGPENGPPGEEHIAAVMELPLEVIEETIQSMKRKRLIANAPETILAGPEEDRRASEPRIARALIAQATENGGYVAGADALADVDMHLAAIVVNQQTARIRIGNAEAEAAILAAVEQEQPAPTPGWPTEGTAYLEYEEPVTASCLGGEPIAMDGMLIMGAGGRRTMVLFYEMEGRVGNSAVDINANSGRIWPPEGAPHNELVEALRRLILSTIAITGQEGDRIQPMELDEEDERRLADDRPVLRWMTASGGEQA